MEHSKRLALLREFPFLSEYVDPNCAIWGFQVTRADCDLLLKVPHVDERGPLGCHKDSTSIFILGREGNLLTEVSQRGVIRNPNLSQLRQILNDLKWLFYDFFVDNIGSNWTALKGEQVQDALYRLKERIDEVCFILEIEKTLYDIPCEVILSKVPRDTTLRSLLEREVAAQQEMIREEVHNK